MNRSNTDAFDHGGECNAQHVQGVPTTLRIVGWTPWTSKYVGWTPWTSKSEGVDTLDIKICGKSKLGFYVRVIIDDDF
jgi:hypothetical protein